MIHSNHSDMPYFFRTPPLGEYHIYIYITVELCSSQSANEFIWVLLKKQVHSGNIFYSHASIHMIIHAMFLNYFDRICDTSSHTAQLKGTSQNLGLSCSWLSELPHPLAIRGEAAENEAALSMPGWSSSGGRAECHDTQGELHLGQNG